MPTLSISKLKQLKDRPIDELSEAMRCKFYALNMTNRHGEAMECAKEWYCLHLTRHTHPPAIDAGFAVIESCMHNLEFYDALLYARTTWETITLSRDSHIPDDQRDEYIAQGAKLLAKALHAFAESGGMPAEEKHAAGVEATMLARRALETSTQVYGTESSHVAEDRGLLASILDQFNDVDDEEIPLLYHQSMASFVRLHGQASQNVAVCEKNLGNMYQKRAKRAVNAEDLDREIANWEMSLLHYREAVRIYRAINFIDIAEKILQNVAKIEEILLIR